MSRGMHRARIDAVLPPANRRKSTFNFPFDHAGAWGRSCVLRMRPCATQIAAFKSETRNYKTLAHPLGVPFFVHNSLGLPG